MTSCGPRHRWPLDEVARWPDYARDAVAEARAKGEVRDEGDALVMPLSFVMQLDLAEVRALDPEARLPARGLLLFFASSGTDVADARFAKRVASAVRWIDAPRASLRTHSQPPTPDPYPSAAVALRLERRVHLDLSWEARTALLARVASPSARAWIEGATEPCDAVFPAAAEECVGPMLPDGWVSVLRVVDHGELGLHVGDASWVTFATPREDLDATRFDGACASVFIG